MKIWAIRRGYRLEPLNADQQGALERIPAHKPVEIEVRQRRNAAHHALYWSLLTRIAKWFDQDDVTPEVLHELAKLECGVVHVIRLRNGETRKLPGSASFAAMDQIAFAEFFERFIRVAYEKWEVPPALIADLLVPQEAKQAA